MTEELKSRLDDLNRRVSEMEVIFDVGTRAGELAELEKETGDPGFWDDQNRAKSILAKATRQRDILKSFDDVKSAVEDAEVLTDLAAEETGGDAAAAESEAEAALKKAEELFGRLEFQSLLNGKFDGNDAYLTLHAGAGGTESCDWAAMLLRMYRRYCENNSLESEILEYQPGDEAGVKRVSFRVGGPCAYGYMKAERGVHRLVRISPFDANKRRHTSFCALDVVAEVADDVDVELNDADLRIDTYRASGAGGQHVNTTDSAVRITHVPTGAVAACQAERSQHMNKAKALKLLRAKVYELIMDRKRKEMERFYGEKGDIAWGSQIRSYVLQPYTMVKDHRTGAETSNTAAVLDGDIQLFIESYLRNTARSRKE
ncbi:MAG: peptide chain release factor 2 [Kiritimatiellia bacterium]